MSDGGSVTVNPTRSPDNDPEHPKIVADDEIAPTIPDEIVGRSPGQLAWIRFKRDKAGVTAALVVVVVFAVAYLAPVIEILYGVGPLKNHSKDLDAFGYPLGLLNGVSADHWLGLQPGSGRDVFMQIVYGMRTSLTIALISAVLSIALGAVVGAVSGYFSGKVDAVVGWIIDVFLCFPFLIFAMAIVPVIGTEIAGQGHEIPAHVRAMLLVATFTGLGWMPTARLVRGQVLSLREREFVEAARAVGAGPLHIIFKQILPNVWAPILVAFSLAVPALVTAAAALSFLGIGMVEPTPELGRILLDAVSEMERQGMWFYMVVSGGAIFVLVFTFNLFGDSLRDALDPKSNR